MRVRIYVEGGGNSKELRSRCREGFSTLIERAGISTRMPSIVACGGREEAFDSFKTAIASRDGVVILLVDSEDPVTVSTAWQHLAARDGWQRPAGAVEDHAQLMVTCMETWIMADHAALASVFGQHLQKSALLPQAGLEKRFRDQVQAALEDATRACGPHRAYRKGRRSFQILCSLDPATLKMHLPHFKRFVEALDHYLRLP